MIWECQGIYISLFPKSRWTPPLPPSCFASGFTPSVNYLIFSVLLVFCLCECYPKITEQCPPTEQCPNNRAIGAQENVPITDPFFLGKISCSALFGTKASNQKIEPPWGPKIDPNNPGLLMSTIVTTIYTKSNRSMSILAVRIGRFKIIMNFRIFGSSFRVEMILNFCVLYATVNFCNNKFRTLLFTEYFMFFVLFSCRINGLIDCVFFMKFGRSWPG